MNTAIETLVRVTWRRQGESREALVPCLIGPSGSGKTARVRAWAAAEGRDVVVLHAQALLPEDLALPRPRGRAGAERVEFLALPQLARCMQPGAVLFVDEFDKALDTAPATAGAMLALLWERRYQSIELHGDTRIIVAMQPTMDDAWHADELRLALARRMLWLPLGADWSYVAQHLRVPTASLTAFADLGHAPQPPVGDPCPRTVCEAAALAALLPRDEHGEPDAACFEALLRGLFAERWHAPVRDLLLARDAVPPDLGAALDRDRETAIALAESMPLADLVAAGGAMFLQHGCADAYAIALRRVAEGTSKDILFEWQDTIRKWITEELSRTGGAAVDVVGWPLDNDAEASERLAKLFATLQELDRRQKDPA